MVMTHTAPYQTRRLSAFWFTFSLNYGKFPAMKSKKTYTLDELISLLEVEVKQTGSRKEAAVKLGVSAQYLGDVLNSKREPGKKILDALKIRKVIRYEEGE